MFCDNQYEKRSWKRMTVYMYKWITLLYIWNKHDVVNQVYYDKILKTHYVSLSLIIKGKIMSIAFIIQLSYSSTSHALFLLPHYTPTTLALNASNVQSLSQFNYLWYSYPSGTATIFSYFMSIKISILRDLP